MVLKGISPLWVTSPSQVVQHEEPVETLDRKVKGDRYLIR